MPGPIVGTGQSADMVLGQTSFTGTAANAGGASGATLSLPNGIGSDGTRLWVADSGNGRVLQWNRLPTTSGQSASIALGRSSLTTVATGGEPATATNVNSTCCGTDVASDGVRVVVSDTNRNRGMVWGAIPSSSGTAASIAIGQPSLTSASSPPCSNASTGVCRPRGIWTDGSHLIIADWAYHRVLIWNSFPTTSGDAADVVLGQANFGLNVDADPPSASTMSLPEDVFYDGSRLYVSDSGNNRVLVWNGIPTTNGKAADLVLGQSDFASSGMNAGLAGVNAGGFHTPVGLAAAGDALFVADQANNRVLVFTPIPSANGASATYVLGKTSLTDGAESTASATTLNDPRGLLVVGNHLFVVDKGWNRVVRYQLNLP